MRSDRSGGVLALRALVLMPGALVEGALAVLLPWMIAREMLHSSWLGFVAAAVVLVPMLGALAAPMLSGKVGARRLTVVTAVTAALCLGLAGMSWVWGYPALAFGCALAALAADAACDILFASRVPLLARLSRQPLVGFSSGNWLWGLPGAAAGSLLAGWALSEGRIGTLLAGLVAACAVVALGLAALLPRDGRPRREPDAGMTQVFSSAFWTRPVLTVSMGLMALVFFVGPMDNLLIPAQLAARAQPASLFGSMAAAAVLGVAIGLLAAQSRVVATRERALLLTGLLALAAQVGLLLWLPTTWIMLTGIVLTSALCAPLLPLIETRILRVSNGASRALLLATVTALMSAADVLGTLLLGATAGVMGSEAALWVVLVAVGIGFGIAVLAGSRAISSNSSYARQPRGAREI